MLALLYWLMSVLIPQLIDSVTMLIKNARYYYYKVYRWADTWLKENPEIGSWANDMLSEYYNNAVDTLTGTILPKVQEMAAALTGGIWTGIRSVVSFALMGLVFHYLLEPIAERMVAKLPRKSVHAACMVLLTVFAADCVLSALFRTPITY